MMNWTALSVAFFIAALPDHEFTFPIGEMDNDSLLSGLLRGLKNILGDAVGGSDKTDEEKIVEATDKLAKFVAGVIGDGTRSVSPREYELRDLMVAWLVARKWKTAAAEKYARKGDGVHSQWVSLCEKNSLDPVAGQALYDSWVKTADNSLAVRAASAAIMSSEASRSGRRPTSFCSISAVRT